MIKFRQKEYSSLESTMSFIKNHPTIPLSAATLGISSVNLATNMGRRKEAAVSEKKQIAAMNKLTDALVKVRKEVKITPTDDSPRRRVFPSLRKN